MDVIWRNLVYSARMLWKKPGLTAVAIIAIGLGIDLLGCKRCSLTTTAIPAAQTTRPNRK